MLLETLTVGIRLPSFGGLCRWKDRSTVQDRVEGAHATPFRGLGLKISYSLGLSFRLAY